MAARFVIMNIMPIEPRLLETCSLRRSCAESPRGHQRRRPLQLNTAPAITFRVSVTILETLVLATVINAHLIEVPGQKVGLQRPTPGHPVALAAVRGGVQYIKLKTLRAPRDELQHTGGTNLTLYRH